VTDLGQIIIQSPSAVGQTTTSSPAAAKKSKSKPPRIPGVVSSGGKRGFWDRYPWIQAVLVFIVIIGAWELTVRLGWQNAYWVSRPSLVAQKIWAWVKDGTLQTNIYPTLEVALLSFVGSLILALIVGSLLHASKWLDDVLGWYLNLVYAIPKPALIPLLIFAFGLGVVPAYFLVISLVFFILYYNVRAGLATSKVNHRDALLILGAKPKDMQVNLVIPTLIPFLVSGARFGIPLSILGTVFAEFYSTTPGMGELIHNAQLQLDSTSMMAAIVLLTIFGTIIDLVLRYFDRRVSRWKV
jgi:NitT/TauT family transport system permease protein